MPAMQENIFLVALDLHTSTECFSVIIIIIIIILWTRWENVPLRLYCLFFSYLPILSSL